uniref:Uncharacterized protein n=1 Tax=Arundo donax TaxID=35708 RepID=A0A0A9FZS3_ARUDO
MEVNNNLLVLRVMIMIYKVDLLFQ